MKMRHHNNTPVMAQKQTRNGHIARTYEETLMYGQYRRDLGEFAKRQAVKVKQRHRREQEEKKKKIFYKSDRCSRLRRTLQHYWDKAVEFGGGDDWLFLTILGVSMAVISFLMDYTIDKCIEASRYVYHEADFSKALQFFVWILFPIVLVCFSVGFTHIVGPNAIGSGIPEMKTVLRGVVLKEYLTTRTFIAKIVGLCTALGSGLPIGKEGPFVHVASLAATFIGKGFNRFKAIYENESRFTEMLAAACAVGVASTFAAPIGGVLFSIEVTATYFAVRNYWRAFYSAVCGALIFRGLAIVFRDEETLTPFFPTSFRQEYPFDPVELIAYVFLGILCGCAGAFFVFFHRRLVLFIRQQKKMSAFLQKNRFIFPTVIVIIVMGLLCPLGLGQYMAGERTNGQAIRDLFSNTTWAGGLSGSEASQQNQEILKMWRGASGSIFITLALFAVARLLLCAISITIPFPSGVFAPAFAMGAAFGRLTGESLVAWFPAGIGGKIIIPGGYAVVGAAAMSGAVTHTVSTAVIAFEMTGQINLALPCVISVLVANAVAYKLEVSMYDSVILLKKLPFLPDIINAQAVNAYAVCVEDFMIKDVKFISLDTTYLEIFKLLKSTHFRAFPLVDSQESMILLGSIQRYELERMILKQLALTPELKKAIAAANKEAEKAHRPQSPVSVDIQIAMIDDSNSEDDEYGELTDVKTEKPESKAAENNNAPKTPPKMTRFAVEPVKDDPTPTDTPPRPVVSNGHTDKAEPETPSEDMLTSPKHKKLGRVASMRDSFRQKVKSIMKKPPAHHRVLLDDMNLVQGFDPSLFEEAVNEKLDEELAKFPIRVSDIEMEDFLEWEIDSLREYVNFEGCRIDPAPFQLVERTSLYRVHSIFSLLNLHHCYVTNTGRLVGMVAMKEVRLAVEGQLNSAVPKTRKKFIPPQHDRRTEHNATTVSLDTQQDVYGRQHADS